MSSLAYWRNEWENVTNTDKLFATQESEKKRWDYDKIESNYITNGRLIVQKEYDNAKENINSKADWKLLLDDNVNTCAIKLSWALNHAGYIIPKQKTKSNLDTWRSNLNIKHNYI